jgi:hypothetical protein
VKPGRGDGDLGGTVGRAVQARCRGGAAMEVARLADAEAMGHGEKKRLEEQEGSCDSGGA